MQLYLRFPYLRFFFVIIVLIQSILYGFAQEFISPLGKLHGKVGFICGLDNRRTWIESHSVGLYGGYGGVSFQEALRVKLSVIGLPQQTAFEQGDTLVLLSRFGYISLGCEWDFFRYQRFTTALSLQGGYGRHIFREYNVAGAVQLSVHEAIVPLEVGIYERMRLNRWLDVKAGVGWRHVFPTASILDGPYLKVGFGIRLNPLLEALHLRDPST